MKNLALTVLSIILFWAFSSYGSNDVPANAYVSGNHWFCNDGYRKQGNACTKLNVPANAYVSGNHWFCNDGYRKQGNACTKLNVPANAYVSGNHWFCNDGYRKQGNTCTKLNVPANAYVSGNHWFCNDGYRKQGNVCTKLNVPANAYVSGNHWFCNDGYRKQGNVCTKLNVPANAYVSGNHWFCNDGYKKQANSCVEMSPQEKQDQEKALVRARAIKSSCRSSEDAGIVVKEDVCGSGNSIIETTDGWFIAAEHYFGVYLYEGDLVCGDMKIYGFQELHRSDGSEGQFYIEDWESDIGSAYEELCD